MFTTGINDECIIKWKVTEDKVWQDLDNLDYNPEEVTIHNNPERRSGRVHQQGEIHGLQE